MKYEDRIVMFLDILSFKNEIFKTISNEKEIKKIHDVLNIVKFHDFDKKREVTQFSDSIVVSFRYDNQNQLLYLLDELYSRIISLFEMKIILRGAISCGKLIHTKEHIFGPAFIKAYEMETKCAIYPRIIIDDESFKISTKTTNFYKDGRSEKDALLNYLSKDEDDLLYLDYFKCSHHMLTNEEEVYNYAKHLNEIIQENINLKDSTIKIKYGWMKNKFNNMVDSLNYYPSLKSLTIS